MQPYLALPSEILIAAGESADKVFLVVTGKIQVLECKEDGSGGGMAEAVGNPVYKVIHLCEDGSIMGDFKPNSYTFRAAEYSECYVLHLADYIECFSYITQSNRGRKASKKNLADDFFNVVQTSSQMYGSGFIVSKKARKESGLKKAMTRVKSLVSAKREGGSDVEIGGRSSSEGSAARSEATSMGSPPLKSVVPILE